MPQDFTRHSAAMLAITHHHHAIHEYVIDALGVLVGVVLEGK